MRITIVFIQTIRQLQIKPKEQYGNTGNMRKNNETTINVTNYMVKRKNNPAMAAAKTAPNLKEEAELGGGGGSKAELGFTKTSTENFIPALQ